MRRIFVASLIVATSSLMVLPAFAQEETPAPQEPAPAGELIQPAVVVPPPADDAPEAQWTYKFLIPLGLVVAALAVFVTVVQYFVKVVRSRYKLVE